MDTSVNIFENMNLDEFILAAFREDVGSGDITTLATVSPDKRITGEFASKANGVFCGADVIRRVFSLADASCSLEFYVRDGDRVRRGQKLITIEGNARQILTAERTALNIAQHMSGIASAAAEYAEAVKGTKAKICDTRKTTPGMRVLEKYAVRVGGGVNHRFNLSDGILIKDNHINAAGGITEAIKLAKARGTHFIKTEVEVESLDGLSEALDAGADIIMLDNMPCDMMREAVKITDGRAILEASGNMGEKDLREVAETGVDLISVGALTHSVKALDISLKFTL